MNKDIPPCTDCGGPLPANRRFSAQPTLTQLKCNSCRHKYYMRRYENRQRAEGIYMESRREQKLKRTYGITGLQFEAMKAEQANCCALCFKEFTEVWNTHIDHCHENGHIRGLLCNNCNVGLGAFNDSPALLRRAIEYLNKGPATIPKVAVPTTEEILSAITF